ncbi:MAG TPA: hypothetical protein VIV15_04590 [Anaerolineales bacterium]
MEIFLVWFGFLLIPFGFISKVKLEDRRNERSSEQRSPRWRTFLQRTH